MREERGRIFKNCYQNLTRAAGISVLSLLTNMSLQRALCSVGVLASASPMAPAASVPNEFPLSLRVVRSCLALIWSTISSARQYYTMLISLHVLEQMNSSH